MIYGFKIIDRPLMMANTGVISNERDVASHPELGMKPPAWSTEAMMNETTNDRPILVLAANGKTGRRVTSRLEERGLPVRRGSRTGQTPFDWNEPQTWGASLEGVRAAYIVYTPDLSVPGAPEAIEQFAALASSKGVEKLVLLSGRGEPGARRCEQIVASSGLAWTIVRAGWFNQNFDEGAFAEMVRAGTLALPNADVPEAFVDCDDIADVAVAALTEPGHDGEVYELTGPRLMTLAEAAAAMSEAAGRPIEYVPITMDAFTDGLAQAGVPAEYIELLEYLLGLTATGRNASVADGVERALGLPARDFSSYAADAAATGAWSEVTA
jgi:uncharacterized protein YbjT (DUF2867 family)